MGYNDPWKGSNIWDIYETENQYEELDRSRIGWRERCYASGAVDEIFSGIPRISLRLVSHCVVMPFFARSYSKEQGRLTLSSKECGQRLSDSRTHPPSLRTGISLSHVWQEWGPPTMPAYFEPFNSAPTSISNRWQSMSVRVPWELKSPTSKSCYKTSSAGHFISLLTE